MGLSWGNSVRNFQNLTKRTAIDVEKSTMKIVDLTAKDVKRYAEQATPVKSGKLKRSWKILKRGRGKNRKVEILNRLDYASLVENGTSKMPPKRMLAKAVIRGDRLLKRRLEALKRLTSNKFNRGA